MGALGVCTLSPFGVAVSHGLLWKARFFYPGSGFRVPGLGFGVWGLGFRV